MGIGYIRSPPLVGPVESQSPATCTQSCSQRRPLTTRYSTTISFWHLFSLEPQQQLLHLDQLIKVDLVGVVLSDLVYFHYDQHDMTRNCRISGVAFKDMDIGTLINDCSGTTVGSTLSTKSDPQYISSLVSFDHQPHEPNGGQDSTTT